jgi:hypothetical protein
VTAVPAVAGWLLQVSPPSVHGAATRKAWSVLPVLYDAAKGAA